MHFDLSTAVYTCMSHICIPGFSFMNAQYQYGGMMNGFSSCQPVSVTGQTVTESPLYTQADNSIIRATQDIDLGKVFV